MRRERGPVGQTRRTVLGALGAALAAGGAAGCGTAAPQAGEGTKTQAPVTLRYVGSFAQSAQTTFGGGAQTIVERFNARGTPITVEPITPAGNRNEAALSMITAGDPPDLFHALPRDYHPFANLGALLDLSPYVRKDRRAQDVIPMILAHQTGFVAITEKQAVQGRSSGYGYRELLKRVVRMCQTGEWPLPPEALVEPVAFQEAALLSGARDGAPVGLTEVGLTDGGLPA